MLEVKSEKKSRFTRLSDWICMPFRRGPPSSYIDPTPPIRETEEAEIPNLNSIAYLQQRIHDTDESRRHKKTLDNGRQPRSRYRAARPRSQIPISQPQTTRQSRSDERDHARGRSNSVVARARESPSPDDEAPRTKSQIRSRIASDNNEELPASPQAQPPPLTRASLEMINRRNGWDNHRGAARRCDRTAQHFGDLPLPRPTIATDTARMSSVNCNPRSKSRVRHSWHGNDAYQQTHSRESSSMREDSRRRHEARRSLPPPGAEIVPLRGDSGKVLVHSKSRGYKIVRNLVSLNGLRDVMREQNNEPRHVASLERMAEEDRRASQELFS